ncbi:growth hormone secretagogue receptor type 1-like isoform X2 [Dreissena polymorpha]|nr:growth hormone secretagogue receptor type 1-like isoform X2 [Dreissena polymorpha]
MNSSSLNVSAMATVTEGPVNLFANRSYIEILLVTAPQVVTIDRVVTPIWYIIGFIGNPISAKIWLSRTVCKSNSSALYFGILSIVETLYLILHVIYELHMAWGYNTYHKRVSCELFNFFFITPQYMVPMLVLAFTTERYIAVCHPFVSEKYCTVTRAKIVIGCMSVTSIALGLVQVYIWAFDDAIGCVFRPSANGFHTIWTWVTEMLLFLVIPVACLVINVLVIREIKRIQFQSAAHGQGSNPASTTTLLCVSFYFILTLLPATIFYAIQTSVPQGNPYLSLEKWASDPTWKSYFLYLTMRKAVEEICLSNYASYFIIYYITGTYFQKACKEMCMRFVGNRMMRSPNRAKHTDYSMSTNNGNAGKYAETVILTNLEP